MRPHKSGAVPGMSDTTAPRGANGEQVRSQSKSEPRKKSHKAPVPGSQWFPKVPCVHTAVCPGKSAGCSSDPYHGFKCSSNCMSRFAGNIFGSQSSHQERSK